LELRETVAADWPAIFPIFSTITVAGETYAYPDDLTSEEARELWTGGSRCVVAVEDDEILGTSTMGPNRTGRGDHIATGSFMVAPGMQGRGVGRKLGEDLVRWAGEEGFRGIQFNAVVETNAGAMHLWQSLGFEIIGTVPGAFHHPEHGYVGLCVMFRPVGTGA